VYASTRSAEVQVPKVPQARSGISWTDQLTPATPVPLFPAAPIVPAVCVP
jgi:hypothetical protein